MIRKICIGFTLLAMLGMAVAPVWADRNDSDRKRDRDDRPRSAAAASYKGYKYSDKDRKFYEERGYRYDSRYRHNRYYPPRGHIEKNLPRVHRRY